MRKTLFALFVLLALTLTACKPSETIETPEVITPTPLIVHTYMPDANPALRYENAAFGIGFVFPEEYRSKYTLDGVWFDNDKGGVLTVIHTASSELMGGYPSMLFFIERWPTNGEQTLHNLNELGRLMLQTDDYAWFMRTPTGVEYDESDPEPWQTTEYKQLYTDELLTQIIASSYAVEMSPQPPAMPAHMTDEWLTAQIEAYQAAYSGAPVERYSTYAQALHDGEWWAHVSASKSVDYGYERVTDYFVSPDGTVHEGTCDGSNNATFIDDVERPDVIASPKTLLEWESVFTSDGMSDDMEYTFPDGTTRVYEPGKYVLLTNEGFSSANATGGSAIDVALTDNPVMFVGDESPGEGAELLDSLKSKMNASYSALEKALTENPANIDRGQFADWSSDLIADSLSALKLRINATEYVTTLGNFAVFDGPYTTLYDLTTGTTYFCKSYHGGGFIGEADFGDLRLFLPTYFAS